MNNFGFTVEMVESKVFVSLIEQWLPNYDQRDDVSFMLDLAKFLNNEVEDPALMFKLLTTYGSLENIKDDYIEMNIKFYMEALAAKIKVMS